MESLLSVELALCETLTSLRCPPVTEHLVFCSRLSIASRHGRTRRHGSEEPPPTIAKFRNTHDPL